MADLSSEDRALLRLYIADPASPSAALSDDELDGLNEVAGGSLEGTAARAWRIKAARVADWYLANVDGSFLSRDQVFDHCLKMAQYYEGISGTSYSTENLALTGPNSVSEASSSEF